MTRSLNAAGCISRATSTSSFQAVWITDALLTDSLQKFSRTCRRHGSNVPGPLEAQRRASKRRNGSLAYNGGTQPPTDPTLLFAEASQPHWWQTQQRKDDEKRAQAASAHTESFASRALPFIFPSWLYPQPEPSPPATKLDWNIPIASDAAVEKSHNVDELNLKTFNQELKRCRNTEDIHSLITSRNINLRTTPKVAISIFGHVLDSKWSAEETSTYLTDPKLNLPSTRNHVRLVRRIVDSGKRNSYNISQWKVLFSAICKSARLGLIAPEELREIINVLLTQPRSDPLQLRPQVVSRSFEDILALLESFEDSQIFGIKDLGQEWLSTFSSTCAAEEPDTNIVKLLWKVKEFEDYDAVSSFSAVVQNWLRDATNSTTRSSALLNLPAQHLLPVISRVTEDLVSQKNASSELALMFEAWTKMLRTICQHPKTDRLYGTKLDLNLLQQGFTQRLDAQEQLLALAWIVYSLKGRQEWSKADISAFSMDRKFEEIFPQLPKDTADDKLATVVLKLQNIPLLANPDFLRHLSVFTKYDYILYTGNRNPNEDVQSLTNHELASLGDDALYKNAISNFNDALVELCRSTNSNLSGFTKTAVGLINTDKLYFRIVTRLLKHNLDFNFALSQSAKYRSDSSKDPYDTGSDVISTESSHVTSLSPSFPAEALDTINRLSVAFARTTAAHPRTAFRQVYWCYLFLHRYGAPIEPIVSSALWYAGITRYGIGKSSRSQRQWILELVREVEGQEVASALLLNPGFREHRQKVFEQLPICDGSSLEEVRKELERVQSPPVKMFPDKERAKFLDLSEVDPVVDWTPCT